MNIWGRESGINLLGQALDYASYRQQLLADNIANVETPDYRRKDADFNTYYRTVLKTKITHPKHLSIGSKPNSVINSVLQNSSARNDGNNVDIEWEMAELARNTLYYRSLSRQISKSLVNLKIAISEGRR